MTKQRDLKALVRERMERTGEGYVVARRAVVGDSKPRALEWGRKPRGAWFLAGSTPDDYEFSIDPHARHDAKASAVLRASRDPANGFGTLMQEFRPENLRGRRVRFAAEVKTESASSVGLWMRVDARDRGVLAFDNMSDRRITGTTEWTRHEVVLDVDAESALLAFGVLLVRSGTVWIANIEVQAVAQEIPVTGKPPRPAPASEPRNLDFDA